MKRVLTKRQLEKLARAYRDINAVLAATDPSAHGSEEEVAQLLTASRNRLGELLRWQDFDGAWQDATRP